MAAAELGLRSGLEGDVDVTGAILESTGGSLVICTVWGEMDVCCRVKL